MIAGFTTWLFFPETSGIPVETTHTVFRDHWYWPKAYPEILDVHAQPLPPPKDGPLPHDGEVPASGKGFADV